MYRRLTSVKATREFAEDMINTMPNEEYWAMILGNRTAGKAVADFLSDSSVLDMDPTDFLFLLGELPNVGQSRAVKVLGFFVLTGRYTAAA